MPHKVDKDVVREVATLRAEIERHNRLYYVEAAPEISDREYDRLMHELIDLGVDGLMTDRPGVLRDVLRARGLWAAAE